MPIQLQGNGGVTAEVDDSSTRAARVVLKALGYGSLGHYRTTHQVTLANTQAANSRLFELRNTATNLIVLTRLTLRWLQTANHTAAILDSLDCYKCTGFTAVDTTNTVTPTVSVKRGSTMAAAPGGAAVRGNTVAGAAAGMTGGTLTKDGNPFAQLGKWLVATQPTAGPVDPSVLDAVDDVNGTHPFVFAQNEGFIVENRILLGAAAGSVVYIDCSWAEVTAF